MKRQVNTMCKKSRLPWCTVCTSLEHLGHGQDKSRCNGPFSHFFRLLFCACTGNHSYSISVDNPWACPKSNIPPKMMSTSGMPSIATRLHESLTPIKNEYRPTSIKSWSLCNLVWMYVCAICVWGGGSTMDL